MMIIYNGQNTALLEISKGKSYYKGFMFYSNFGSSKNMHFPRTKYMAPEQLRLNHHFEKLTNCDHH